MILSQIDLDNYTKSVKKTDETINNLIGANTNNLQNWFNDYWISNRSMKIAIELDEILNTYQLKIIDVFNEINIIIKKNVMTHNNNENNKEKVFYNKKSLKQKKSNITNNLNATLPNESIGRLQGTANVYYPIEKTISTIEAIDKEVKKLVNSCEVISNKNDYKKDLQIIKNEIFDEIEKIINKLKSIYNN